MKRISRDHSPLFQISTTDCGLCLPLTTGTKEESRDFPYPFLATGSPVPVFHNLSASPCNALHILRSTRSTLSALNANNIKHHLNTSWTV
ncbi:hypothetical protein AVEN_161669-1 [Araneus ventricosus]|uniref:Uncharacterized protein n=1 Tax=Araneus ventricosus TaxID=182803 RepID=A0A4Y2SXE0_ARAVE|nr:hypothetical protein AVEN_161669-1 [Araneus ventricosus]